MLTLADATTLLRVTKGTMKAWHKRGLVEIEFEIKNNRRSLFVTKEEVQRLKAMMYPYGMPEGQAPPLSKWDIKIALEEHIKLSWLPYLVEWGVLRAGRNPLGVPVVADDKDIKDALANLQKMGRLRVFCYLNTTAKPESVLMAKRLFDSYQH